MYSKKEESRRCREFEKRLQDLSHERGGEIVEGKPGNDEVVTDVRFKRLDAADMHVRLTGGRLEDGITLKALPQQFGKALVELDQIESVAGLQ